MKEYLEHTGLFSSDEIEFFLKHGKERLLKKGELFIREGEVANKVAYMKSGLVRSFYYSSTSDEVTYCFTFPHELVAGYSSLISGEPTSENLQAICDCELIEYPKKILDELVSTNMNWLLFSKLMAESQYIKLEKRIFLLQKENAITRYRELMGNHSEYLKSIPLGYLASYLGVSQRHLSRLRKQIGL